MSDAEIRSSLACRATPLDAVEPGHGTADLAPWREVLACVRVVGFGEATHGTREFFTLKHRLIAFLVEELGVRVVAMEASESASTAVTVEARLAVAHPDDHLLDLRAEPVPGWLRERSWTRNIGAVAPMFPTAAVSPIVPADVLDGLAYVHRTHASVPRAGTARPG